MRSSFQHEAGPIECTAAADVRGERSGKWASIAVTCALLVLGTVGCKGGEGDPCKTQNDCGGGLSCCPIDRSPLERGSCEAVCSLGTLPPGLDAGFFNE